MSEPVSWERRASQIPGQPDAYFSSDRCYAIVPASGQGNFALVWLGTTGVAGHRQVGSFPTLEAAMRRAVSVPAVKLAPATIKLALGIAIGGAAASAVLSLSFAVAFINASGVALIALSFLLLNIAQVGLNAGLLRFMLRRSTIAWLLAVVLVSIGALAEVADQVVGGPINNPEPYLSYVDVAMWGLLGTVSGNRVAGDIGMHWLLVHTLAVQLPILVLLLVPPSRRWCRAP